MDELLTLHLYDAADAITDVNERDRMYQAIDAALTRWAPEELERAKQRAGVYD